MKGITMHKNYMAGNGNPPPPPPKKPTEKRPKK